MTWGGGEERKNSVKQEEDYLAEAVKSNDNRKPGLTPSFQQSDTDPSPCQG